MTALETQIFALLDIHTWLTEQEIRESYIQTFYRKPLPYACANILTNLEIQGYVEHQLREPRLREYRLKTLETKKHLCIFIA